MPFANIDHLAERSWQLQRGDGSVVAACLTLAPSGRIIGATHPNETSWRRTAEHLEFLNPHGNVTTRFVQFSQAPDGALLLEGDYLGAEALGVRHILAEQIRRPAAARSAVPRFAVLVRTHLETAKLRDLLKILKAGQGYDVFICADETNASLPFADEAVIAHSETMCGEIGLRRTLPPHLPKHPLLWYFGDYPFYCAYHSLPDYDYYVMIEYDVEFARGNSLMLEALLQRLKNMPGAPYDFLAPQFGPRTPEWSWSETVREEFGKAYGVLFPFVLLSKRALLHLYQWRQMEAATRSETGRFAFCEAFAPSALMADGSFRCGDVNDIIPGSWEPETFRVGKPMLLNALPPLRRGIELVHPVFSEREWLRRTLDDARREGKLAELVALLENKAALPLAPDLRASFLAEARPQHLG